MAGILSFVSGACIVVLDVNIWVVQGIAGGSLAIWRAVVRIFKDDCEEMAQQTRLSP